MIDPLEAMRQAISNATTPAETLTANIGAAWHEREGLKRQLAEAEARHAQTVEALRLTIEAARVATEAHDAFIEIQTRGNAYAIKDAMEALRLAAALAADTDSQQAATRADLERALRRAIVYLKHMEMPDTGVVGPEGQREHDYHRAGLADEIRGWEKLV